MLVLDPCMLHCKAITYAHQSDVITARTVILARIGKDKNLRTSLESILSLNDIIISSNMGRHMPLVKHEASH